MTFTMNVPLKRISLKYLVLAGFLISLIPLGIFVWQSTSIQKNINGSWQKLTDNSIESVRTAVELESSLIAIERSMKQSLILQTKTVSTLANNNIQGYLKRIESFCVIAPDALNTFCSEQKKQVKTLQKRYLSMSMRKLNSSLITLSKNQATMMNDLWKFIDDSKAQQIATGQEKQRQVMIGLLVVSFLTFILLILLSSQVATPVEILKNKINQLGKEKEASESKIIEFNGPKELLEINTQLDWLSLRLTKLEMLRQSFLRHASHEFKTPLASIMESCSILKDKILGPLTTTQQEVVGILEDCTHNLKHLTEQLLDYNYLLQNSNPNIAEHNALTLINDSKARYEQFFIKRKQEVVIDCQLQRLNTDAKLFTRVIDNLLSNAQAYGFEKGQVLVQLDFDVETHCAVLMVANTGPKVPENQQSNILEPFGRSDVPRYDSLPGTGLGLSIVRDCVHLLNGSVAFVDIPNFDFAIKVSFPSPLQ